MNHALGQKEIKIVILNLIQEPEKGNLGANQKKKTGTKWLFRSRQ